MRLKSVDMSEQDAYVHDKLMGCQVTSERG